MLGPNTRNSIKSIFTLPVGTEVTVTGWVKTRRDSKGIHFLQLSDGSCFRDLQVVLEDGVMPDSELADVTTGACVKVTGELVESPAAGQPVEVKASGLTVTGKADPADYPLQKKGTRWNFFVK